MIEILLSDDNERIFVAEHGTQHEHVHRRRNNGQAKRRKEKRNSFAGALLESFHGRFLRSYFRLAAG